MGETNHMKALTVLTLCLALTLSVKSAGKYDQILKASETVCIGCAKNNFHVPTSLAQKGCGFLTQQAGKLAAAGLGRRELLGFFPKLGLKSLLPSKDDVKNKAKSLAINAGCSAAVSAAGIAAGAAVPG